MAQRRSGTARRKPSDARATRLIAANARRPAPALPASTSVPRRHNRAEASVPSGSPAVSDRTVAVAAVATVCTTASATVRRKPGDKSGGNSAATKRHVSEAVRAVNTAPTSTPAARHETASAPTTASSHTSARTFDPIAPDAVRLPARVECGCDTVRMRVLDRRIAARAIQAGEQAIVDVRRRAVEDDAAAVERDDAREVPPGEIDGMQRHDERTPVVCGNPDQ